MLSRLQGLNATKRMNQKQIGHYLCDSLEEDTIFRCAPVSMAVRGTRDDKVYFSSQAYSTITLVEILEKTVSIGCLGHAETLLEDQNPGLDLLKLFLSRAECNQRDE